jgi:hypothetical protein
MFVAFAILPGRFMSSVTPVRFAVLVAAGLLAAQARPQVAIGVEPRIVGLAATPQRDAAGSIREPFFAPPAAAEPAAAPQERSRFVPIALPESASAPQPAAVPTLPPTASFAVLSRTGDGPQLTAPTVASPSSTPPPQRAETRFVASGPAQPAPSPQWSAPPAAPSTATHVVSAAAMQPVAQRAMHMADNASAIAQRGMFFSARNELLSALQLIAQALDVQAGSAEHAAALSAGLVALAEARDFASAATRATEVIDVPRVAATHRTPLLRGTANGRLSPIVAQQQYFAYAQAQFAIAAGGVPAASQILYRLGRLQTAISTHDSDPSALHGPQSIVFHQASLAADPANWLAANELGVLYARYGQLAAAKQLLVYSVTVQPHVEGWHNLAAVHRRLGEGELAALADGERKLLAERSAKTAGKSDGLVRWVDAKSFAAASSADTPWPASVASASTSAPTTTRR